MNSLLILLGKLVLFLSRTFDLGSGSTWPGHVAVETNPRFIKQILSNNPNLKVVIVAGTNGKTTTSLMLQETLEEGGLKVFRNEAGANLLNGIASAIITNSSLTGKLNFNVAIFEVDERNVSLALEEMSVVSSHLSVVLLNIFRDQLDRYGEVNQVLSDWKSALQSLRAAVRRNNLMLFTNGDDPALSFLTQNTKLKTYYFGIEEKLMKKDRVEHDVDFIYCPNCQTKLVYEKISFSHMGKFKCPKCGFTNPKVEPFSTLPHPLFGNYNTYNVNAAALVAHKAFDVPLEKIQKALINFKPAFGRQEIIKYKGRDVLILLSKNPAGFNQSIEAIRTLNKKGNVLLVLNDRIPDGRDVSWIWDVDLENLPKGSNIFISGDRAYDMALRIKYVNGQLSDVGSQLFEDLSDAIETATNETKPSETLFILPTYSAMLEVRKILTGKKIL